MLFALDLSVNKKAPRTHSVNWGFSPPPPPPQQHHPFFFTKSPLKSGNYPAPLFRQFTPNILVFHAPSKQLDFTVNSHNIKTFHP